MRVAVYGLGNVLMGDDALGPYAVEVLRATHELPDEVTVADLGTPGLDLAPYLDGLDALVLLDTVSAAGAPGEVRAYRLPDIVRHAPGPRLSPHDPGVKEALLLAGLTGNGPAEVLLVGVVPASTATGVGLSPAVAEAIPAVVAAAVAELRRLGVPVAVRPRAEAPRIWWEEMVSAD
jgi:hydrogenase maturation protease